MDAWSALPTPEAYLEGPLAARAAGRAVVQEKQCRNCHALGGEGGRRGPALDDVATRLTRDQLIRQVLQGGGEMPAYGKNLSPRGGDGAGRVPRGAPSASRRTRPGRQWTRPAIACERSSPAGGRSSRRSCSRSGSRRSSTCCGWLHLRSAPSGSRGAVGVSARSWRGSGRSSWRSPRRSTRSPIADSLFTWRSICCSSSWRRR